MFKILFSPIDKENACGMFTAPHLISLFLCLAAVCVALYFSRNISKENITKVTRIFAYVFTVLEFIKIIYKFSYGYTEQLDFWLPLSFCSLFIYALWLSGYGRGLAKKLGDAFIVGGCFTGGFTFLIIPATSLMDYPIYHFLSMHSMLFHSCMVFMSLIYIKQEIMRVTLKNYRYFFGFVGSACVLAIILNLIFDSNLMIMRNPVNIPIDFVNKVAEACPPVFTVCAFIVYTVIPYLVGMGFDALFHRIKKRSA